MARRVNRNPTQWSRWERDKTTPSMDELIAVHKATGASLDWLLLGVDMGSSVHQRLLFLLLKLPDREVVKLVEWLEVRFSL
ncbi:hypothetical protein EZMO1_2330 [Endozoicomonas montiporae CL-33]|uniref:HTH cro/C1-type domain-containing protein n=2 Tax=Endozoicomonas montiporae TaxID=1027273 RepID=A0A142BCF2_9GAMM|nr:hypothetical protein EZMO1_2330 [Endozoicomonas montiporae CL-33]